jgi:hypothetical protein
MKSKHLFSAIVGFTLFIFIILDMLVFMYNPEYTLSNTIHEYLGGGQYLMRTSIFSFVAGWLFNHWTGWTNREK